MHQRLCPKSLRKVGHVQHHPDTLQEGAIESFSDSILLWGIMGGESSFSSLFGQVVIEHPAKVLATMIGPEFEDLGIVLGVGPGFEVQVRLNALLFCESRASLVNLVLSSVKLM